MIKFSGRGVVVLLNIQMDAEANSNSLRLKLLPSKVLPFQKDFIQMK